MANRHCPLCGVRKKMDVAVGVRGADMGPLFVCGTIYWPARDRITSRGEMCQIVTKMSGKERAVVEAVAEWLDDQGDTPANMISASLRTAWARGEIKIGGGDG